MPRRRSTAFIFLAGVLAWCGGCGDPTRPPTPEPNPGTGEMITGRERLGWTQRAENAAQLATFDYALYVDGSRRPLAAETCTASGAAFACSAALPPLTPGAHALALAAFVTIDGALVESAPSAPLQVTVTGATSPAAIEDGAAGALVTPEGARLHTAIVERGLHDPADLAAAPDGRLFVAERSGAIAIVSPDRLHATLDDRPLPRFESLESLAVDPGFARTRRVFAVYRTLGGFTIVRLREAAGRFGEAAVVREIRAPAAGVAALARFGSDRKLYVAIGAGPDPLEPQNPASPLGKILRLEADGSIPADNPGPSPVFSSGHHDARGLAWDSQTGTMWAVERDEGGDELNAIRAGVNYGWPLARGTNAYPGAAPAIFTYAPGTDVGSAAFVPRTSGGPFAGTLLVAARGAQDLLRMSFAPGPIVNAGDRLLHGRFGRIGHVVVAGGSIYLTTANSDLWGPGQDLVIKLWVDEQ